MRITGCSIDNMKNPGLTLGSRFLIYADGSKKPTSKRFFADNQE
jgi:hypothetical protein